MKAHFQLSMKVLGLLAFAFGLYWLVEAVDLLLTGTPVDDFLRPFVAQLPPEARSLVPLEPRDRIQAVVELLAFEALPPIIFGLYLLRPENLFLRLAYPEDRGERPSPPPRQEEGPASSPPPEANDDPRRYAPPGYEG